MRLTESMARRVVLTGMVVAVLAAIPGTVGAVWAWKRWGPRIQIVTTSGKVTVRAGWDIAPSLTPLNLPRAEPIKDSLPSLEIPSLEALPADSATPTR